MMRALLSSNWAVRHVGRCRFVAVFDEQGTGFLCKRHRSTGTSSIYALWQDHLGPAPMFGSLEAVVGTYF